LPDGRTVEGYLPAPLEPGDTVTIEGKTYVVEAALTLVDDLLARVVQARLGLPEG
jgi:hypothetical protein